MPSSAVRSHPVNNKKIPVRFGISAPTSSSFPSSVRRHKTMQRGPKGSTPVVCPSTEKTKKKNIIHSQDERSFKVAFQVQAGWKNQKSFRLDKRPTTQPRRSRANAINFKFIKFYHTYISYVWPGNCLPGIKLPKGHVKCRFRGCNGGPINAKSNQLGQLHQLNLQ